MARKKDPLRKSRKRKTRKLTRQEQILFDLREKSRGGKIKCKRYGFTSKKLGKSDTCVHYSLFAAKTFFDAIVEEDEWQWIESSQPTFGIIETDSGIVISGSLETLEAIASYKLKPKEEEYWRLPDGQYVRAQYIRSDREYVPPPETTPRKRNSRKGMILAKQVAKQMNIKAKELRTMLRKSDVEKPAHGWAWRTQAEVEDLIVKLTGKIAVDFTNVKEPK